MNLKKNKLILNYLHNCACNLAPWYNGYPVGILWLLCKNQTNSQFMNKSMIFFDFRIKICSAFPTRLSAIMNDPIFAWFCIILQCKNTYVNIVFIVYYVNLMQLSILSNVMTSFQVNIYFCQMQALPNIHGSRIFN